MNLKDILDKKNIPVLVFAVFVFVYGIYYVRISNWWIMAVCLLFIAVRCYQVKRIRFDINLLFLGEAFLIKAMLDQHTGKSWKVPETIAIPFLVYLAGMMVTARSREVYWEQESLRLKDKAGLVSSEKTGVMPENKAGEIPSEIAGVRGKDGAGLAVSGVPGVVLIALALGQAIVGLVDVRLTHASPIWPLGYYSVAFLGDTVYTNRITMYANFIMPLSLMVAAIVWLIFKWAGAGDSQRAVSQESGSKRVVLVKKMILAAGILAALAFGICYFRSIHFQALKEAAALMVTEHWGNFHFTVLDTDTSGNMWLDYGRESGIMVFAPLFIFFLLTIKDVVRMMREHRATVFVKAFVLISFVLWNIYYWMDATAFIYPYYWFFGLFVSGVCAGLRE